LQTSCDSDEDETTHLWLSPSETIFWQELSENPLPAMVSSAPLNPAIGIELALLDPEVIETELTTGVKHTAIVNKKESVDTGLLTQSLLGFRTQSSNSMVPVSSVTCCTAGISSIVTERAAVESSVSLTTFTIPFMNNSFPNTG